MNRNFKSLTGKKFGRLEVISFSYIGNNGTSYWKCKCECDNITIKSRSNLISGQTQSCGCLRKESAAKRGKERFTSHGFSHLRSYESWRKMMKRCYNKKDESYKYYGGRGITVCERWHILKNFLEDMGERPDGLSIERINNNNNYYKENCK